MSRQQRVACLLFRVSKQRRKCRRVNTFPGEKRRFLQKRKRKRSHTTRIRIMRENNNTNAALLAERVKRAIQSRRKFIVEKKNELGEKSFRRLLETDLRLSKRQLDEPTVKETIGKLLLEVIERGTLEEEDELEEESEEDEYSEEDDEDDQAKVLVKRKRKKSEKQPTRERKTETETPNAKVSKLRKLCKDAGITKATHVFMKFKTNLEREDALEKLLGERALDIRATARELAKVKEDIEREKDLEDIDASNIIEGGRRRNTRTQVSYKGLDASESEEEEEEEEESDVEIESDSDEERKKLKKKKNEKNGIQQTKRGRRGGSRGNRRRHFQPETSHSRRVFGHQIVARKSAPIGNEFATFILFLKLDIPPRESESRDRFPPPASGREPI
mmetsp:Transcript_8344/g.26689  ORF Transcript_8344/g.26689 Transcript_8344/m.26689 type:complete len:389 (+) Transcript_8344:2061-3227(+)